MQSRTSLCLLFITLCSALIPNISTSAPADTFVYGSCSQLKYAAASPYQTTLNSLLASLLTSSSASLYNNYSVSSPTVGTTLSSLYQCRGDIPLTECARCVQAAINQLGILCQASCGGVIQLQGCIVKYDNFPFVGVPDKTLVVKKCGVVSGGGDVLSRRDELLTELERLRTGCGPTASGDVYLAKCFLRYSTGGVSSRTETSSTSEDKTGKTFAKTFAKTLAKTLAISIGPLAGVALGTYVAYKRGPWFNAPGYCTSPVTGCSTSKTQHGMHSSCANPIDYSAEHG